MEKIILTIAPTGNVPTKEMTPHVPITPEEIAAQVYECWKAGAAVAHFHTRDEEGKPTSSLEANIAVLKAMDKYTDCNIIRQLSTGGRAAKTYYDRGRMLPLAPEMASLATGSSNFPKICNFNDPDTIAYLAEEMNKYNIKPEIEVFDTAMMDYALKMVDKGVLKAPLHFNLVMGMTGSQPATEKLLFYLYECLPKNCTWGVSIIGQHHVKLSTIAIALGGHVRVGVEDNIYYTKGVLASNIMLLERMKNIAKAIGREVATADEARVILGLPAK